jgi:hypothetical protein
MSEVRAATSGSWNVAALNEGAQRLGYEVIEAPECVGYPRNMGHGPWCWIRRDGEPVFSQTWRAEEVGTWLRFREREAP